ncbi:TonB-dependent receptor family protein [Sphingobacterium sp. lm-10]|uniref:TonB-dependent receptor n=1 Tax=Sphingobacterium sp. lm-10 TaxID=2944904 RepID=UPI002022961B|nr:TonB-dependent receptor [Sphingobacterium sp. lm-10]MCL7988360.1 TonB-dependent receptor family protein [Sphingobacterium sp. lm-10]
MKSLKIACISVLVLIAQFVYGQTGKTVQGMLRDTEARPISGATVKLVSAQDSMVMTSSPAGIYNFEQVKAEKFKITVSSLGFDTYSKDFEYPSGQQKIFIPSFVLDVNSNLIEEVVISGVLTVQVKGDTVEYSAQGLKLREGAVAEDALKRLQGVEVDKDGNVTAQGESVTRVRINGKDFFGGDVKTATKNLPANIIDKIQIVDDYGDMANITGNRTGDSEKVLNIQIDPKYNSGWMTTLRAAGGTDERFQTTGMLMGMTNKTQVSVLGNWNNLNASLFDFQTVGGGARNRSGGGGRPGGGQFGNNQEGITETSSIGLNVRHDFTDKFKIYGSYSFERNDNNTLSNTFREYIGLNQMEEEDANNNSIRANHRFETNIEWNISDKDYIKLTPQFGFNDNATNNMASSILFRDSLLDNSQLQNTLSNSTTPRYNLSGLYNRRLNNRGRNFFINFNVDNSVTTQDLNEALERLVYDPTNQQTPISEIYQQVIQDVQNKSWNAGTSISYTEPLTDKSKIEVTYDYNISDYDNFDRQRAIDREENPIDGLPGSNYNYDYDYSFTTHRAGASYMFENDKIKYSFGAAVQPSLLRGDAFSMNDAAVINRTNFNFVPIARFEYKFSRQSNITMSYSGRATEPTVTQILPFEVTRNLMTTTGNPNLDPEFRHQLQFRVRAGDVQKGKTFFAVLRTELINDRIVSMNQRFNRPGEGIYQFVDYINERDPVYNINSFYMFGRSLKDKTYNIMYMGGISYNKNVSYLATDSLATFDDYRKNTTNNIVLTQNAFFRYTPSENLEINPGVRFTYNMTNSSLPEFEAPNITTIAPSLIGSVNLGPNTIFGADLSKSFNRGFANNANPFIINSYIEHRFLKGQRGALRLQGFDLLNQQINLNRSVGEVLTDTQTNRLARYFLLSFTFRFQKFALGAPEQENNFPGGMRRPRM